MLAYKYVLVFRCCLRKFVPVEEPKGSLGYSESLVFGGRSVGKCSNFLLHKLIQPK